MTHCWTAAQNQRSVATERLRAAPNLTALRDILAACRQTPVSADTPFADALFLNFSGLAPVR